MTHARSPEEQVSALEALLFLAGEPARPTDLAKALGCAEEDVSGLARTLATALRERGSGLAVVEAQEGIQLVTAQIHADLLEAFLKSGIREQLTPAASETLAIVAYRGPIHRAGVEAIRGVNSSFTLRLLALRGLVERSPSSTDSRMMLYAVSAQFLRHLGLARIEDLPEYDRLHAHEGMTSLEQSALSAASAPNDTMHS